MACASVPWSSQKSAVTHAGADVVWQVGIITNRLADYLGAQMVTSRWRVCLAFWFQALVFPTALFVLTRSLGNMPAVVSWVVAVGGVLVWWLGVFRDHQKDDVVYLQKHIPQVGSIVCTLEAVRKDLGEVWGLSDPSETIQHASRCLSDFRALLCELKEREEIVRKRFRLLPPGKQQT